MYISEKPESSKKQCRHWRGYEQTSPNERLTNASRTAYACLLQVPPKVVAAVLNVAANRHFFCINDVTAAVLHEQALAGLGFTIEGSWPCLAISDPCTNTGLHRADVETLLQQSTDLLRQAAQQQMSPSAIEAHAKQARFAPIRVTSPRHSGAWLR